MERFLIPEKRPRLDEDLESAGVESHIKGAPNDISQNPDDEPRQPNLKSYPSRLFGGKPRSFSTHWYEAHSWLEYSTLNDSVYCFACRHFNKEQVGRSETAFTHDGFANWKKGIASLNAHAATSSHKGAMQSWTEFKQRQKTGSSIAGLLDSAHNKTVQENRRYIRAVVEVLRFTCCQNIAQRGHREDNESVNRGNFLELLSLLSNFDEIVKKKIADLPGNAKYTHHDIQNEIINIMANMIKVEISDEIKNADHFSLLVDETKDVSKTEQISIVARYLHNDDICESFLGFTSADGLDAQSLLKKIKETLSKCNIDKNICIGQCYDGAAVMSGCSNGVQEKFREEVPQAIYIHCFAHRLNLALVDCVHGIQSVAEFFETVQRLYNFFSGSVVHDLFMKVQKEIDPKKQPMELKRLSDTRWSCQDTACLAVKETFPAIRACLDGLSNDKNAHRATEARATNGLLDMTFVVILITMKTVLHITKLLSDHLQSPELELCSAIDLVHTVISELEGKRTENEWEKVWKEAVSICEEHGISTKPDVIRKRSKPRHFEAFVITSTHGDRSKLTESQDFRSHIYFQVIDQIVNELKRRFSDTVCHILKGVSALNPQNKSFLELSCILDMALNYGISEKNLQVELHQTKRLLNRKKEKGEEITTLLDFYTMMKPYRDAFIDLYKLICIGLTLPVTSASCERSFSRLKIIKSYIRNSSTDNRTSDIAVLAINANRAKRLCIERVTDSFAVNHNNRRITLS